MYISLSVDVPIYISSYLSIYLSIRNGPSGSFAYSRTRSRTHSSHHDAPRRPRTLVAPRNAPKCARQQDDPCTEKEYQAIPQTLLVIFITRRHGASHRSQCMRSHRGADLCRMAARRRGVHLRRWPCSRPASLSATQSGTHSGCQTLCSMRLATILLLSALPTVCLGFYGIGWLSCVALYELLLLGQYIWCSDLATHVLQIAWRLVWLVAVVAGVRSVAFSIDPRGTWLHVILWLPKSVCRWCQRFLEGRGFTDCVFGALDFIF